MKKTIFLLLIFPLFLSAQELLPVTAIGEVIYTGIIKNEGIKRAALYDSCLAWCNKDLIGGGGSLEIADTVKWKISGIGKSTLALKSEDGKSDTGTIKYNFKIIVRDNKYQYTFSDITWTNGSKIKELQSFNEGRQQLEIERRNTISSFFQRLTTHTFRSNVNQSVTKTNTNNIQKYLYPNGNISSEGSIRDGKPDGYWKTYYENGKLKSEGNRKNFELDSVWKFYNEEGKITLEINYKSNKKQGTWKDFWENGNIRSEGTFRNDKRNGVFKDYMSDGKLFKMFMYENDSLLPAAEEVAKINERASYYPNGRVKIIEDLPLNNPPEVTVNLSKNESFNQSGSFLKKAGGNIIAGGLCFLAGIGLAMSAQINYNQIDITKPDDLKNAQDRFRNTVYLGIGLAVLGTIEFVIGGEQLFKAGQNLMDASKNSITFQLNADRLTLCYRF